MALTKTTTHDARGRGDYLVICREWTIIKDDSVEVSRSKVDRWINPDSDWSSEPTTIQAICDVHFTSAIKTEFADLSDEEKSRFRR